MVFPGGRSAAGDLLPTTVLVAGAPLRPPCRSPELRRPPPENHISPTWATAAASALRCKVGRVPFLYLGLPIGGDPRRLSFWEPLPQAQTSDAWQWQPDPVTGYSVRGAYQLLTSQVPLKVSIFAWRLLRDRLPTKANLVTRGIIPPEAHYCVTGCGGIETAQHLFFTCGTFGSLWWSQGAKVFFAVALSCLCMGVMDRKISSPFQQLNKNIISIVGQG
ncbi:hypothetical protein TSUD_333390 [Trifolium subterraneum]|uniref:Reverse transcriptase zinc-binding domain-containing protein n=1 Tax=Trifolium subterraneum TaxID=3900 RepID=A0A2Z6MPC2_TRISU|nr:hypothetical protein TSUD_333390 [Trifolium subterraneum]